MIFAKIDCFMVIVDIHSQILEDPLAIWKTEIESDSQETQVSHISISDALKSANRDQQTIDMDTLAWPFQLLMELCEHPGEKILCESILFGFSGLFHDRKHAMITGGNFYTQILSLQNKLPLSVGFYEVVFGDHVPGMFVFPAKTEVSGRVVGGGGVCWVVVCGAGMRQ